MRRRRKKKQQEWELSLKRGEGRKALIQYLCAEFGHYRRWRGTQEQVQRALWAEAAKFVFDHGLTLDYAKRRAQPVIWVWIQVYNWICCLAHRRWQEPKTGKRMKRWVDATPEERRSWWVGWDQAQEAIEMVLKGNRRGAELTNLRKAMAKAGCIWQAHQHRREGMTVADIAREMDCDRSTVYSYLREPDPGEDPETPGVADATLKSNP